MIDHSFQQAVNNLYRWHQGQRAGPVKIDLEPTASCSLNCKFCWQRSKERLERCSYERLLSEDRLLGIVDEAAKLGVKEWQVAGGWEPTEEMDKCRKIMSRIKQHGMYGSITTNGTNFSEKDVEKIVRMGWDQILFSLEGPDAATHDYLTGTEGSFNKLINSLKWLKKYKKRVLRSKPNYSVHMVLTNANYDKLPAMVKLGHKYACSGVNFEPLEVWSEEGRQLKLNEEQKQELPSYIERAKKLANKLGVSTRMDSIVPDERMVDKEDMHQILQEDANHTEKAGIASALCFAPWLTAEVRVSGHVVPCRLCDDDSGCDFIHDKSLKEIWFGDYFQEIRNRMKRGNPPGFCDTCAAGYIPDMRRMREELVQRIDNEGPIRQSMHFLRRKLSNFKLKNDIR